MWQAPGTAPGWPRPGITSVVVSGRSPSLPRRIPILMNATGQPSVDPEEIRNRVVESIAAPVRWREVMERLREMEVAIGVRSRAGPGALRPGQAERIPRDDDDLPGGQPARRRSRGGVSLTAARNPPSMICPLSPAAIFGFAAFHVYARCSCCSTAASRRCRCSRFCWPARSRRSCPASVSTCRSSAGGSGASAASR